MAIVVAIIILWLCSIFYWYRQYAVVSASEWGSLNALRICEDTHLNFRLPVPHPICIIPSYVKHEDFWREEPTMGGGVLVTLHCSHKHCPSIYLLQSFSNPLILQASSTRSIVSWAPEIDQRLSDGNIKNGLVNCLKQAQKRYLKMGR